MAVGRQRTPWAPLAVAGGLLLALLVVPYGQALLLGPSLARRLATIQVDETRLAMIDREFDFLRYLRQNQPPYPDALLILSKTMAPGSHLDSVTMNRRGEMALKGFMRTAQEIVDFRSKLVDSGFFSTVVIDEQNPAPNHQKVDFRISAKWKPIEARQGLEILKIATNEVVQGMSAVHHGPAVLPAGIALPPPGPGGRPSATGTARRRP